jgi:hypothetical protein
MDFRKYVSKGLQKALGIDRYNDQDVIELIGEDDSRNSSAAELQLQKPEFPNYPVAFDEASLAEVFKIQRQSRFLSVTGGVTAFAATITAGALGLSATHDSYHGQDTTGQLAVSQVIDSLEAISQNNSHNPEPLIPRSNKDNTSVGALFSTLSAGCVSSNETPGYDNGAPDLGNSQDSGVDIDVDNDSALDNNSTGSREVTSLNEGVDSLTLPRKLFQYHDGTLFVNHDLSGVPGSQYIAATQNLEAQNLLVGSSGDQLLTPQALANLSLDDQVSLVQSSGLDHYQGLEWNEISNRMDLTRELYSSDLELLSNKDFSWGGMVDGGKNIVPLHSTFTLDFSLERVDTKLRSERITIKNKTEEVIVEDIEDQVLPVNITEETTVPPQDNIEIPNEELILENLPPTQEDLIQNMINPGCLDETFVRNLYEKWPTINSVELPDNYEKPSDLEVSVWSYYINKETLDARKCLPFSATGESEIISNIAKRYNAGDEMNFRTHDISRKDRLDLAARLYIDGRVSNRYDDDHFMNVNNVADLVNHGTWTQEIVVISNEDPSKKDVSLTIPHIDSKPIAGYEIREHAKNVYGKTRRDVQNDEIELRQARVKNEWESYLMANPEGTKKEFYTHMIGLEENGDYVYDKSVHTLRRDVWKLELSNRTDDNRDQASNEAGADYMSWAQENNVTDPLTNPSAQHEWAQGYSRIFGVEPIEAEIWYHKSIGQEAIEPNNLTK